MNVQVKGIGLILVAALLVAGCAGAPTPTPTSPPAAATNTSAPSFTATPVPEATATEVPLTPEATFTAQAEASPTTPREEVVFEWEPGSVPPGDADDVTEILLDLQTNPGILGGTGDETRLRVAYDPTVITVEEIMVLLEEIGHPVVIPS